MKRLLTGIQSKVLFPFSYLYGIVVGIRNKLFDRRIFPTETFSVPVISVGNLSVGGTGKTPHTEYLIRLLSAKYKIAVLSRGYKRKSKGFVLAGEKASSRSIGDEPYQMFCKFPNILVAVDGNRRRGIKTLLNLPEEVRPEIILLDDAFQHRYVTPSLSILLTDYNRLFYEDALLPAGRLRESPAGKKRAQIVIVTKCPEHFQATDYSRIAEKMDLLSSQELFATSYKYKGLLPVFPENNPIKKDNLDRLKKASYSILLFAGLANPSPLIRHLEKYTTDIHSLIYPDHHSYTEKDIEAITETFAQIKNKKKIILISEKDAARLDESYPIPKEIKASLFYIPIEVYFNFNQENSFIQKIENHVTEFTRNRFLS